MPGITSKNMYKSKFTGCKSIQPLRSVLGGITFAAITATSFFGVGLYQLKPTPYPLHTVTDSGFEARHEGKHSGPSQTPAPETARQR